MPHGIFRLKSTLFIQLYLYGQHSIRLWGDYYTFYLNSNFFLIFLYCALPICVIQGHSLQVRFLRSNVHLWWYYWWSLEVGLCKGSNYLVPCRKVCLVEPHSKSKSVEIKLKEVRQEISLPLQKNPLHLDGGNLHALAENCNQSRKVRPAWGRTQTPKDG